MDFLVRIVAFVIGYAVGVFASNNIVLPVFWAWPKARRLGREGRLVKTIPVSRFLLAPLAWGAVVLGTLWFAGDSFAYQLGLLVGFLQVAKLLFRPNNDMEADFADSFGDFIR